MNGIVSRTDYKSLDDAFNHATAGYAMDVPCIWEGCDREVMWWADQHGCRMGPACDAHMRWFLERLGVDFAALGWVRCRGCGGTFGAVGLYIQVRPL